jgi:hypothetical protein
MLRVAQDWAQSRDNFKSSSFERYAYPMPLVTTASTDKICRIRVDSAFKLSMRVIQANFMVK